eukprot:scpid72607/ scgid15589/ 
MEGCCRCVRGAGACTCQYNALHTPVQGDHKRHYHSSLARTYTSTSANLQLRSLRSNLKCKSGTLDQLRSHHCTCTSCVCTAAFVPLPGCQGPVEVEGDKYHTLGWISPSTPVLLDYCTTSIK